MPLPLTVKTLTLTVAAGGTGEDSWTTEKDITLKKIVIAGRGGADLTNVVLYIEIAGEVLTKPIANAALFAYDSRENPELNLALKSGSKIYVKAENKGSSDVTIDIMFIYS